LEDSEGASGLGLARGTQGDRENPNRIASGEYEGESKYRAGNSHNSAAQRMGLQLRQPALTGFAEAAEYRCQNLPNPETAQLAGDSCKPLLGGVYSGR